MEPEFFTAVHATWLSGHGVVLLNPDWTDFETRTVIVQGNVGVILYALFTPSGDFNDVPQYTTSELYGPEGPPETVGSPRSLRAGGSARAGTDAESGDKMVQVGDEFWVSAPIVEALEKVLADQDSNEQPVSTSITTILIPHQILCPIGSTGIRCPNARYFITF